LTAACKQCSGILRSNEERTCCWSPVFFFWHIILIVFSCSPASFSYVDISFSEYSAVLQTLSLSILLSSSSFLLIFSWPQPLFLGFQPDPASFSQYLAGLQPLALNIQLAFSHFFFVSAVLQYFSLFIPLASSLFLLVFSWPSASFS
jgi:hypothetical protein